MSNSERPLVRALELDRDGDWDGAHRVVQPIESNAAYRIHAYLHRKEGDLGNAGYWYSRAGIAAGQGSLEDEWQALYDEMTATS